MNNRGRSVPRTGVAALIAVALLAMTTLLLGAWFQTAVRCQRAQRAAEHTMQSFWLAEAALERAAAQLAADPRYTGETWKLTAGQLGLPSGATIVIRVEPSGEGQPGHIVRVRADYPDSPTWRVRTSRQMVVRGGQP